MASKGKSGPIDAVLLDWNSVDADLKNSGLLLGNGASRFIWDGFAYDSLFEIAKNLPGNAKLRPSETALFSAFGTTNFEGVLNSLSIAARVQRALGKPYASLKRKYEHIREALASSVHDTHIAYANVPGSTLDVIVAEMHNYEFVYTTNYDLLTYWSVMHVKADGFKDFFWGDGNSFDLADTDVSDDDTRLLFLHGALHLYIGRGGRAHKLIANQGTLLRQFRVGKSVPLFVSEGDSSDKLRSIGGSDYLSFAYNTLANHVGPIVVFGSGLGDSDAHLVSAINTAGVENLAIGVFPSSKADVKKQKAHFLKCFPDSEISFFDLTTHPMGDAALKVTP